MSGYINDGENNEECWFIAEHYKIEKKTLTLLYEPIKDDINGTYFGQYKKFPLVYIFGKKYYFDEKHDGINGNENEAFIDQNPKETEQI